MKIIKAVTRVVTTERLPRFSLSAAVGKRPTFSVPVGTKPGCVSVVQRDSGMAPIVHPLALSSKHGPAHERVLGSVSGEIELPHRRSFDSRLPALAAVERERQSGDKYVCERCPPSPTRPW